MSNDMVRAAQGVDHRGVTTTHPIIPLATGVLLLASRDTHFDAPWSGSGTGRTSVASDGSTDRPRFARARFEYSVHGENGAWTFTTVADAQRRVSVAWSYGGFHAWLQMHVKIERFVRRGDTIVVREPLAEAGPADRRTEPSGSFVFGGTSTFDVQPGDVYGFRMCGSDFDGDLRRWPT
jgi:hypothetical protein